MSRGFSKKVQLSCLYAEVSLHSLYADGDFIATESSVADVELENVMISCLVIYRLCKLKQL